MCKQTFYIFKKDTPQKMKGLPKNIAKSALYFDMKVNILQDFHICISGPLNKEDNYFP